jgi:hypothetical protein
MNDIDLILFGHGLMGGVPGPDEPEGRLVFVLPFSEYGQIMFIENELACFSGHILDGVGLTVESSGLIFGQFA